MIRQRKEGRQEKRVSRVRKKRETTGEREKERKREREEEENIHQKKVRANPSATINQHFLSFSPSHPLKNPSIESFAVILSRYSKYLLIDR